MRVQPLFGFVALFGLLVGFTASSTTTETPPIPKKETPPHSALQQGCDEWVMALPKEYVYAKCCVVKNDEKLRVLQCVFVFKTKLKRVSDGGHIL